MKTKQHTHTFTKLDTKSTTTKCLKLHYQEQMPHQNKMKDIRGENFYNSARQGKWKEGKSSTCSYLPSVSSVNLNTFELKQKR